MEKWRMERYWKTIWFYAFTHTHTCIYKAPMNVAVLGMETGVCVTMGYAQTWEVMHGAWS